MNNIYLRYILEFAVIIPGAFFALLPVKNDLRFKQGMVAGIATAIMSLFIVAGSAICYRYGLSSNAILMPGMILFFIPYCLIVTLSFSKKLYLFVQAMLFVGFGTMYGSYLMAPIETDGFLFTAPTSMMVLLIDLVIGILFYETFTVKLPLLLRHEALNQTWAWMSVIPAGLLVLVFSLVPNNMQLVMTGRIRPVALSALLLIPIGTWLLYHVVWRVMRAVTENHRLQQENSLLQMEQKRYEEMRAYMDATRKIRHDVRQHYLVIHDLAEKGELEQLKEYLEQLDALNNVPYFAYCGHATIDALASYYDNVAKAQNTAISWTLQFPEKVNMNIADYCGMLGNLVENSVRAVAQLPEEKRHITVVSRLISEQMLGLSVENPYTGRIRFGRDGLPRSSQPEHGIGLSSVAATVHKYNGTLDITTENGIFSVNILLNLTSQS